MKILIAIFMVILLASCGNNASQQMNLYVPVHRATDDLQVYGGKYHGHLFDKGLTITCTVVNKSNTINYKDVRLEVLYYSKTNTLIARNDFVVYEYLNAGHLLKAKLNGSRYDGMSTLSVNVVGATPY